MFKIALLSEFESLFLYCFEYGKYSVAINW